MEMEKYKDNYRKEFINKDELIDFICEVAEHRDTQRTLVVPTRKMFLLGEDAVKEKIPEDIRNDTTTGIYIQVEEEVLPLRECASYALDNILGVKGNFLSRLTVEEHIEMLNNFAISKASEKDLTRLFIQDKKVTGINGGNKGQFSEIPALDVYNEAVAYLENNFPKAEFAGGMFSHEYMTASWDLNEHADEFSCTLKGTKYRPVFMLSTSDCGLCSVTVRPYLVQGSLRLPVDPLRVRHAAGAGLEDVREKLDMVYSSIDKGCSNLERLADVTIEHPHTCILRVMKELKIEKKNGLLVAENFKSRIGETASCSALEIFQAICETLQFIPADATAERRFRQEDNVARAAGIDWKKYDLPGLFVW